MICRFCEGTGIMDWEKEKSLTIYGKKLKEVYEIIKLHEENEKKEKKEIMHELAEKIKDNISLGDEFRETKIIDKIIREWLKEKAKEIKEYDPYHTPTVETIERILCPSKKTLEEKFKDAVSDSLGRTPISDATFIKLVQIADEHFK